jgi:hypothetical protein
MLDPSRVLRQAVNSGSDLVAYLTPKQREIELDPSHLRAVWGGRQWGKTTWTGVAHTRGALPGVTNLAIAPTITKARDLLFHQLEQLRDEKGLDVRLLKGDFRAEFPNGGVVQCLGLSTLAEAEKIRGFVPAFATIEECGTYRDQVLEYAIDGCLAPATMRYWRRGGRGIANIGTPSKAMGTYWHDVCLGKTGATSHHATVFDNPFIPDARAYLEQVIANHAAKGWTWDTPVFRREYLGQFCPDSQEMPYGSWDGVLLPQAMAPREGYTVMGIDFGQTADNSWVVDRMTTETVLDEVRRKMVTLNTIHRIHASKKNKLGTDQVAAHTKMLASVFGVNAIVGDGHGQGAQSIKDMRRQFGVPIAPALKNGKKEHRIWTTDSLLASGTMKVYEEAKPWGDEARVVQWNEDRTDHHDRYPSHACDGGLYSLERLMARQSEEDAPPVPGTPEWDEAEAKARWRERMDSFREQGLLD